MIENYLAESLRTWNLLGKVKLSNCKVIKRRLLWYGMCELKARFLLDICPNESNMTDKAFHVRWLKNHQCLRQYQVVLHSLEILVIDIYIYLQKNWIRFIQIRGKWIPIVDELCGIYFHRRIEFLKWWIYWNVGAKKYVALSLSLSSKLTLGE